MKIFQNWQWQTQSKSVHEKEMPLQSVLYQLYWFVFCSVCWSFKLIDILMQNDNISYKLKLILVLTFNLHIEFPKQVLNKEWKLIFLVLLIRCFYLSWLCNLFVGLNKVIYNWLDFYSIDNIFEQSFNSDNRHLWATDIFGTSSNYIS